jgi:zinc D-Ala-D-Ala carboxypeptidase
MSAHFSEAELTHSATAEKDAIENTPGEAQALNLQRLAEDALEPVRSLLGVPLFIHSGFRCPALNAAVGGQPTSAHLDGRAADFDCGTLPLYTAFEAIRESDIPFDQLIIEHSASMGSNWIHLAIARAGEKPRREAFPLTKRDDRVAH